MSYGLMVYGRTAPEINKSPNSSNPRAQHVTAATAEAQPNGSSATNFNPHFYAGDRAAARLKAGPDHEHCNPNPSSAYAEAKSWRQTSPTSPTMVSDRQTTEPRSKAQGTGLKLAVEVGPRLSRSRPLLFLYFIHSAFEDY